MEYINDMKNFKIMAEQAQINLNIKNNARLFNTNKDYMIICPDNEEMKKILMKLLNKNRLDSFVISKHTTEILIINLKVCVMCNFMDDSIQYKYGLF